MTTKQERTRSLTLHDLTHDFQSAYAQILSGEFDDPGAIARLLYLIAVLLMSLAFLMLLTGINYSLPFYKYGACLYFTVLGVLTYLAADVFKREEGSD